MDVFRDGVLLFTFSYAQADEPPGEVAPDLAQLVQLQVEDGITGEPVEGALQYSLVSPPGTEALCWMAAGPFLPNHPYAVHAELVQEAPRPSAAVGSTELNYTFQTGDGFAPPVTFEGELKVAMATGLSGTNVRATLPLVKGGVPVSGYFFRVWITNDAPRPPRSSEPPTRGARDVAHVIASGPSSLFPEHKEESWQVPESDFSYRPCVTLEVEDLVRSATVSQCLDEEIRPSAGCGCGAGAASGSAFFLLPLLLWWTRARG